MSQPGIESRTFGIAVRITFTTTPFGRLSIYLSLYLIILCGCGSLLLLLIYFLLIFFIGFFLYNRTYHFWGLSRLNISDHMSTKVHFIFMPKQKMPSPHSRNL